MIFEDWSEYLFNKIGDNIFDLGISSNKNLTWIFFSKKIIIRIINICHLI